MRRKLFLSFLFLMLANVALAQTDVIANKKDRRDSSIELLNQRQKALIKKYPSLSLNHMTGTQRDMLAAGCDAFLISENSTELSNLQRACLGRGLEFLASPNISFPDYTLEPQFKLIHQACTPDGSEIHERNRCYSAAIAKLAEQKEPKLLEKGKSCWEAKKTFESMNRFSAYTLSKNSPAEQVVTNCFEKEVFRIE